MDHRTKGDAAASRERSLPMDTIYITGHRNPDTDSIVSAMAYAALKNALGSRQYQAARLGQVSDETQIVLDRFGFQPPKLIDNVRTQVRDLDYDTPLTLSAAATISRGWQAMQGGKISILPVANEDGTLYGTLSAGDVANYDMTTVRNPRVERIPIYNLISVLEGKLLNEGGEAWDDISGEVTIALPSSRESLLFSSSDSVVICGDQPDMVRRALDLQVNCVIVCQGEVSQELLEHAGHTCVISTPIAVLESRFRAYPILDEEERVVGMLSRFHLLRPRRKRVVLVDHNEKSQSVIGLDQAEILEIIDHHRLADIETKNPIHVRNEAVGSTNTIVAEMYQEKGLMPTSNMAGLMAAAIVSDTVMFKSPTCTRRDIDMANRLARIAGVQLEDLGKAIFSASCGDDKTAEAMLKTDYKEFHIAGHNLAVSQITTMDSARLLDRKGEFFEIMTSTREKRGLNTVVLMITDVLLEGTQLLFTGDEDTIRQAFGIKGTENCAFLPKIMSRKKQVIPMLSALWG